MGAAKRRGTLAERAQQAQGRNERVLTLFAKAQQLLKAITPDMSQPEKDRRMAEALDVRAQARRELGQHLPPPGLKRAA